MNKVDSFDELEVHRPTGSPPHRFTEISEAGRQMTDSRRRTTDCGLRTTDCGLRTTDCGLPKHRFTEAPSSALRPPVSVLALAALICLRPGATALAQDNRGAAAATT